MDYRKNKTFKIDCPLLPGHAQALFGTGCKRLPQNGTKQDRLRANLLKCVEVYATDSISLWVTVDSNGWRVELFNSLCSTPPDSRFSIVAHFDEWEWVEQMAPHVSRIYVSGFQVELRTEQFLKTVGQAGLAV